MTTWVPFWFRNRDATLPVARGPDRAPDAAQGTALEATPDLIETLRQAQGAVIRASTEAALDRPLDADEADRFLNVLQAVQTHVAEQRRQDEHFEIARDLERHVCRQRVVLGWRTVFVKCCAAVLAVVLMAVTAVRLLVGDVPHDDVLLWLERLVLNAPGTGPSPIDLP